MKRMKLLKLFSFIVLSFLMARCYPDGPEYIEQYDLVYSNYDDTYGFEAKKTYAIPDKIMKVDDDLITGEGPNFVKDTYAKPMLEQINKNMSEYGWTKVEKDDNPDVMLAPVAYELTTTVYWGYGGYWDWWYGGWYGWYYPYYPVTTTYSTGSLVVNMLDPNDLSANDKARVAWTFVVNGLLEGSTTSFTSRYTKGINQAFEQSPYIKK
jgi:hypothetical protein